MHRAALAPAPAAGLQHASRVLAPRRAPRSAARALRGCCAASAPPGTATRRVEYTALEGNAWKLKLPATGATVRPFPLRRGSAR